MKAIESYWKDTVAVCLVLRAGLSWLVVSDFLQVGMQKCYSTKRKSIKNASDSSLQLISYSPTFASHFKIVVALVILSLSILIDSTISAATI